MVTTQSSRTECLLRSYPSLEKRFIPKQIEALAPIPGHFFDLETSKNLKFSDIGAGATMRDFRLCSFTVYSHCKIDSGYL